jgi:hypothetical protein
MYVPKCQKEEKMLRMTQKLVSVQTPRCRVQGIEIWKV